MEIHQLKTLIAVANEGSITRASERLYLSQPAVSAHVKAIEDTLGLTLFDRTSQGMRLTSEGQRILLKAEQTLHAHQEVFDEAARMRGKLTGKLRLGVGCQSAPDALGKLLTILAERYPDVDIALQHGASAEVLDGIRQGNLDIGFYSEAGVPDPSLSTWEVGHFGIYLAAAPGVIDLSQPIDWKVLEGQPWICPAASTCCGKVAENLFRLHNIRPDKMISVDRENVTRTLIAGGVGIGLLHTDTAQEARLLGEVELICEAQKSAKILCVYRQTRANEPLLNAVTAILRADL